METTTNQPKGISIFSIISLIVSILDTIIYGQIFSNGNLLPLFIILAIASIIMPIVAKKHRIVTNKTGKWMEIVAIIVGGFNFYCIIFALTSLPVFIGYLGWVICGVIYSSVK